MIASAVDVFGRIILLRLLKYLFGKQKMDFVRYATLAKTVIEWNWEMMVSPSGDLGISLVWRNLSPPDPTPPQLFGPTVEILFKLN